MFVITSEYMPDYVPLSRWGRFLVFLGLREKRRYLLVQGNNIYCSPNTALALGLARAAISDTEITNWRVTSVDSDEKAVTLEGETNE